MPAHATTMLKGGWLFPLVNLATGGQYDVVHKYGSEMAANFWTAIFAWTTCFVVTILVSLVTRQKKTDDELAGLVYSLTPHAAAGEEHLRWYERPAVLAVFVLGTTLALNILFW